MRPLLKEIWAVLKGTATEFIEDECMSLSAGLAFYTMFSLAPALVIVIQVTSMIVEPAAVEGEVREQITLLIGPQAAEQVEVMIQRTEEYGAGGLAGRLLGIGALVVGATAVLVQLQSTLNRVWGVQPDPEQGGVKNFFLKRLFSLAMLFVTAFLLGVSLSMSAFISAVGDQIAVLVPAVRSPWAVESLNFALSLLVFSVIFGGMFKVLPDADIRWRDVGVGAIVTALLFVTGKALIGYYLGSSQVGTAYGAASSLAVILVWVYYSSLILFLGAEFTQVYARRIGRRIRPSRGAVRVVHRFERVDDAAEEGQ